MKRRVDTNNRLTSVLLVCLLVIGGFVGFIHFGSENAQGSTYVSGIIYDGSGGPWTLAGSPYIVVDDVTVPAGETLTIEPGVQVKFDGYYSIYVNGALIAIGTETNRINITSNMSKPAPSDWRNIQINSNGHAEIKYCDITYAKDGICLSGSSNNNIANNNLSSNANGIYLSGSSNNNIANNNLSNWNWGICVRESSNNIITYNNIPDHDIGIFLWDSFNNTLSNNNFVNNGVYIQGNILQHFNSHTISDSNIVNGQPLYYYKDCSGIIIDGIPIGELILANCTDIDIENLQINSTCVGIEVAYSTNILIANNNISSNYHAGMYIYSSSNNKIIGNNITNNRWGIEISSSSNSNIIANNNISSNSDVGIGIGSSNNNIITNNNILLNNRCGVYIGLNWKDNSSKNIVTNNNVSNNGFNIYIHWVSDNEITGNNISNYGGGIFFHTASNNNIIGNSISNGECGLYFYESSNGNVITGNTILNNGNGSYLESSHYNVFSNNNISSNNYDGIHLDKSSVYNNFISNDISFNLKGINVSSSSRRNTIRNNNVSNNDYGIYITSSAYNEIYHNNFIDNTNQGYDNTDNWNQWDNGYPSGGNYWSDFDEVGEGAYDDYQGPDQDDPASGDGIVDNGSGAGGGKNPYVIDSDSQDNYPLINPADTSPPAITNLQPPDGSTTNDNTPTISADYSDPSGINVSSVVLEVDGVDVTSSATVTASGVSYIPITALPDGVITVYLEVKDNFDNLAIAMWIFTVDTTPPTIINLQPPDASITNDSTPMIGANYYDPSGINVSSVVLKVDGIDVTASGTVTATGVSYIPGTVLSDGVHTVYLEVKDNYNNLAIATWTFTVDTLPPIITNLQPPDTSTTNDSTSTISADYSDPSGIDVNSVVLMVNGIDVTSSATVTAGDVSYLPVTALPDGIHTVYLEIKDNGGNLATATWSFTVDSTPPTITNLQPPDTSTTNETTPIISADYSDLSGINTSSVVLKVDGMDVTLSATVTASNVTYMPGTVLSDGVHTVYLEVKDIYGNLATATWTFTVDTAPPTITNLQPPDASTTNNTTPTISADYSDPSGINVSSAVLKVDGIDVTSSATVTASVVSYIPVMALSEGVHTVYLEVRDIYDNLATIMWNFTVDTLPPTIILITPGNNSVIPSGTLLDFDIIDPNLTQVNYSINGGADFPFSVPYDLSTSGWTDGDYTVQINALDLVGNSNSSWYFFTIDSTPPTITNLQPPDTSTTNDSTPTISADYNDLSGINVSSVMLKVDGIDVTSSATVTVNNVSYITGTALSDGVHTVYLEVIDNVGNLATATWSFTVDTTPPTITNLQPPDGSTTNNSTPTIGGNYTDSSGINSSSVLLEVGGVDVTTFATITASGVIYMPGTALSDGIHTVYLEVKDLIGNLATATWSFTVDTLPPIITNLQPSDVSITNNSTPMTGADYSDPSGINVSSVVLKVDGIDVTSFATVTASGVSYIPGMALPDGIHTVYLEIRDNIGNLATATWSFTIDSTSPIITNLQPPDASTTNDNTSTISANYSDPSGINVSSVLLEVDGINVTSLGTVTASGVIYTPGTELLDGVHTVYLEVRDNVGNLATAMWTFTVDSTPPVITNLQPPDVSTTNDNTTAISADFNDLSGINLSSVVLKVDGIDITSFATVTAIGVSYTPVIALSDGNHTVYLEVKDNIGNLATTTWTFTVDTTPPTISNLQPPDTSITNDSIPIISADYSDSSGINVNSVVLKVDGIDVTLSATVSASDVSYLPGTALSDGIHIIYLEAKDNAGNLATASWSFTVDTIPPTITNLQPPDASITNNSTPMISADYSDPSGINIGSVVLKVDGIDVTSSATVTVGDVSYLSGTTLSDGIHTVSLEVTDNVNNLATATWSFTVDTSPPITTISPDNYTVKLGTLFTLTANDGIGGCGVDYTQYKIDDGQWIDYLAPFSIDTYEHHNITYRSVDNLGNVETENIVAIYVPKAPITTLIIGTPQYGTTPRYVNYSTQFSFSVIDYSGTGYDTYYYIDTSPPTVYVEPFTVSTEGPYTIYYYSIDNLGNIEVTTEFDIVVDNSPPTTDIVMGEPNYVSSDTWVTSATEFTHSVTDGGLIPVGVNYTNYRIWNGTWSEWGIYQNGFTLGVGDGIRYIEFYSIDRLGNEESINNRTYIVDNIPPITTISVGNPRYRDSPNDIWNVTSATTFALSAMDDGVGLNYTEYRIWDNGSWSEWYEYIDGFGLGSDNGTKYLEWLSVDYLGNKEMIHNETYFVDNIPPETNYLLQLEPDNTEARISLIPSDMGSGVDLTKYRLDSGDWIIYSSTFVINESGEHVVYFQSTDKLGNIEDIKEVSVLVEEPGTPVPSDEEKKETNNKPLIALIFAIILLLVGSYVSYKRPLNFKGEITKDRLLTWLIVVLPFVIAEIVTGVVSLATGMLSVPPLLGVGMIVDTAILVIGLGVEGYVYKKGHKASTGTEQLMDREVEE